ncbi:MAG: hypothetical protein AAF703_17590 [Cyanobacteria bacterium P01_D01_bin.105]
MNASAQALSVSVVGKIANISTIFQAQFPSASVDFSPWVLDEKAQAQFDPDSVDIAFSFPSWQPPLGCGCVLLQVYFSGDIQSPSRTLRKIKMTGHDYRGQHWWFSTYTNCQGDYQFSGSCIPSDEGKRQFESVINQLRTLFGAPLPSPMQQES